MKNTIALVLLVLLAPLTLFVAYRDEKYLKKYGQYLGFSKKKTK